jgi:hypothetical protein
MDTISKEFPAFPRNYDDDGHNGMTLRDYFAAKAMAGICSHRDTWGCGIEEIATRAYEVADHMLKARGE